jgi:hypothetical protein
MSSSDAALEPLRRHGCLTTGAVVLLAGLTRSQAEYALRQLWREGAVWRYKLGRVDAWCAGPGRPGVIGTRCGGRVSYISARRLARAALELVASGARALRPARLAAGACGGAHYGLARAILALALDGCAVEGRRSGRHVILVTDPQCAAERLRQVVESGALPLRPLSPPPPRPQGRAGPVPAHVPREMLEALDELVRRGVYRSRSEAVRAAVRELLEKGGIL